MGKRAGTKLFETGAALLGSFNPFAAKEKEPDSVEEDAESDLSVPEQEKNTELKWVLVY